MFKHVLLPTDGSKLSEKSVKQGIRLAKSLNARVTALHVIPKFHTFTYETEMLEVTRGEYEHASEKRADEFLRTVKKIAANAGVECDTLHASSDQPYEEIIKTAKKKDCDLILMASHGRRGLQSLLLGSETQKVLTHSTTPVLVYR
jgi:nucleotide-binding universal stress UspA family protein